MTQVTTKPITSLRRSVANTLKGSAGNLVEWYDVYVYSVFSSYFESDFFDSEDQNSNIYIWSIFAVTFLMRPVGSWFFGWFADRYGRRRALATSVSVMAACSFIVAITPTRDSIGVWAAIILLFCRLLQGFATGGEYGTSATYMSEAALPGRRGFLSSFHYVTLVGGHVLAQSLLLIMLLSSDESWIGAWGWRIGFAIGGLAAIVVFWLRRTMDESLTDEELKAARSADSNHGSMRELIRNYWRELVICILVTMGGTFAFYTYSVTGPNILKANLGADDKIASTLVSLVALACLMLMQPLGGWISDKVGRKTLLVFFGVGGVLFTWVLTQVLPQVDSSMVALLILLVGFIILTGYTSINAFAKSALFPSHVRALGVGFGYALGNSLFGGTAPLLYEAANESNTLGMFTTYNTVAIAISLFVYIFFLRNRGHNFIDNPEEMKELHRKHKPLRFGV